MKSKEEKVELLKEQINNERKNIDKSKEKIKQLTMQLKRLERQITEEQFAELRDVLSDYGINTKTDFENFMRDNLSIDNEKSKPVENEPNGYNF